MNRVPTMLAVAAAIAVTATAAIRATPEYHKQRGTLVCASARAARLSSPDDKGSWTGLDVDLCRAIAAAIFNDANR